MKRYDIAIIGTGPAGISAAINAKIRNKSFILFGTNNLSAKLQRATEINNYLGFPKISGSDLKKTFHNHLKELEIGITEKRINNIYSMGNYFALAVNTEIYEAKSVIIATGVEFTKAIEGEEEFLGRGVSYCATCDAMLYKNKEVAVISSTLEGEKEAEFLNEVASKVYYIPLYKGKYNLNKEIVVIQDKPIKISNKDKEGIIKELKLKNSTIECSGVFVLKDAISPAQLVPGLNTKDGHIEVTRQMETNIKGCFAAGDCTGKPYQYIKAAGEGNVAALSAVRYLDNINEK